MLEHNLPTADPLAASEASPPDHPPVPPAPVAIPATAVQRETAGRPIILECRDVRRGFQMGDRRVEVLKGVQLALHEGELASIVGSSGAGKSTLLHILGLLDTPDSGELLYRGKNIGTLDPERAARHRNREFGFVFQFFHLLPEFTALENVVIPARLGYGGFGWLKRAGELTRRAKELLSLVGLSERMDHLPTQLSGGERQRVALARALINDPAIVFCDEPTGNLDSGTAEEVFALLRHLNATTRKTFLIVTHDAGVAARADVRHVMRDGRFIDDPAVLPQAAVAQAESSQSR